MSLTGRSGGREIGGGSGYAWDTRGSPYMCRCALQRLGGEELSGSTLRIFQFSKPTLKILLKNFEPAFALTHSQRVGWFTVFKRINLMSQKVQHVTAIFKFRELCVFDYVAHNTMHLAVNPANDLSHQ